MYATLTRPDKTGYFYDLGPLDSLFEGLFTDDAFGRKKDSMDRIYSTEKKNEDGSVSVTVSTPGADRENLDVSFEKGIVTIAFNKPEGSYAVIDSFVRRWRVPPELDSDNITATYANGLLSLIIPPRSKSDNTVRKITVN
jgi:HSP20 family protein